MPQAIRSHLGLGRKLTLKPIRATIASGGLLAEAVGKAEASHLDQGIDRRGGPRVLHDDVPVGRPARSGFDGQTHERRHQGQNIVFPVFKIQI